MQTYKRIGNLIIFIITAFFPLLIFSLWFNASFFLFFLTNFIRKPSLFQFLSLILLILPFFFMVASYFVFKKISIFKEQSFTLYIFWLLSLFPSAYFFTSLIAGASMAVVDGGLKGWELQSQILAGAISFVLFAHIIIIPWILLSLAIIRRNLKWLS